MLSRIVRILSSECPNGFTDDSAGRVLPFRVELWPPLVLAVAGTLRVRRLKRDDTLSETYDRRCEGIVVEICDCWERDTCKCYGSGDVTIVLEQQPLAYIQDLGCESAIAFPL
jgi:hypothetical protein